MKMGAMEMPVTMMKARPDQMRMDFTVQGMTGTQAYDGTTGWTVMPFMGKKEPEKMSEDMLKDMKDEADFDGPLFDYKTKGNKVEYIGKEDVQGSPAYKLKLDRKSTRLNSSHSQISYAVFCLKKKKQNTSMSYRSS